MSCDHLCTAAKCKELENRISALEQALELLEASFEAHTNQDIPQAHNYQPKVQVSLAANSSDNSLKVFVKVDESSDDETITLPDAKVEVSLAANSSDNSLKVFVKVGNQSDDETVTLPKQEWDIDLYIPIILARLKAELTAEFDLELEAHAALDFSQAHNYLESKSNLAIDGSFQNNNLYLTVADGQSQDTATISIYIPDAIDGKDGERGLRGFAGTDGIDGIDGRDGIDGIDGVDGRDGIDGIDGRDGIDGIDGRDGIDGIDGVDGIDGIDGVDGIDGISSDGCAIDLIYENNLLTANLTVGQCFSSDNTKIMEFSPIDVEQITCNNGVAESEIVTVAVIKGTEAAELEKYAANAKLLKAQCELEPVAATPDWWQVRIGSDRPQIVCVFRKQGSRTYHSLAIPHPANVELPQAPILPAYEKGNFQGMIVLNDNSKFIINCISENEAVRMCNIAASKIISSYLPNPYKVWITERKGEPVGESDMKPSSIMYFSQGQRNLKPDWRFAIPPDLEPS